MRLPFSRKKEKTPAPENPPAPLQPKKGFLARFSRKPPAGKSPCPKCKTLNPEGVNFCKACGSPYPGKNAAPAATTALPAERGEPKVWLERGNDLYRKGLFAEALECYTVALDIDPGYAKAWNNKALVFEKMGNATEARACREMFAQLSGR
jgi:tetratricopeptide (TPR) repeat protein